MTTTTTTIQLPATEVEHKAQFTSNIDIGIYKFSNMERARTSSTNFWHENGKNNTTKIQRIKLKSMCASV